MTIKPFLVQDLIAFANQEYPHVAKALTKNAQAQPELFNELGEYMLANAKLFLGDDYLRVLTKGYSFFSADVTYCQLEYEHKQKYRHSSFEQVFQEVYDNLDYMTDYHWGVYLSTFAWEHHLRIFDFFRTYFLTELDHLPTGNIVEFGSGSGVWGMLCAKYLQQQWQLTGVDISKTSAGLANDFMQTIGYQDLNRYICANALTYQADSEVDAGISCFLFEHLENPKLLLENMFSNLKVGGLFFLTVALTAGQTDHIYEVIRESEVVLMAEEVGFRVKAMYSDSPSNVSRTKKYLPRSMALVLQKKHNEIW